MKLLKPVTCICSAELRRNKWLSEKCSAAVPSAAPCSVKLSVFTFNECLMTFWVNSAVKTHHKASHLCLFCCIFKAALVLMAQRYPILLLVNTYIFFTAEVAAIDPTTYLNQKLNVRFLLSFQTLNETFFLVSWVSKWANILADFKGWWCDCSRVQTLRQYL